MSFVAEYIVTNCRECRNLDHGMESDSCRKMSLNDWFTRDPHFHINRGIHPLCPYNTKKQKE